MSVLAWVEECLPGETPAARLDRARGRGLALEVANRGELDVAAWRASGVRIVSVQAWRLHEVHALHPDAGARAAARVHVEETIRIAAALGARHVVTACGFGDVLADRPGDRARAFFSGLAPVARREGVRVLIEPLAPRRCAAMAGPGAIRRLLADLAQPEVFGVVLDTGHLLDGGDDARVVLRDWPGPVDELQLKGPDSTPPLDLDVGGLLRAATPAVVAVEHRAPLDGAGFGRLCTRLEEALG